MHLVANNNLLHNLLHYCIYKTRFDRAMSLLEKIDKWCEPKAKIFCAICPSFIYIFLANYIFVFIYLASEVPLGGHTVT